MSKQIIPNYTFNAGAKTITLTDFSEVRLDRILLPVNSMTLEIMSTTPEPLASSPEEVARLIARVAIKIPWNWIYLFQDAETCSDIELTTGVEISRFFHSMELAVKKMPPSLPTKAITNALGLNLWKGQTLGSRRREFAQKHDISERTLIRHERKGAEQLAALIYPDYTDFEPGPEMPTFPELFPTAEEWADLGNQEAKLTDAERIVDLERRLTLVERALAELQKSVGKPL